MSYTQQNIEDEKTFANYPGGRVNIVRNIHVATPPEFPTEFLPDILGEAGELKDSTTTFAFALARPQIVEFRTLGKNVRCFIEANSTIVFTLKKTGPKLSDVEFIFTGDNRASSAVIMNADGSSEHRTVQKLVPIRTNM